MLGKTITRSYPYRDSLLLFQPHSGHRVLGVCTGIPFIDFLGNLRASFGVPVLYERIVSFKRLIAVDDLGERFLLHGRQRSQDVCIVAVGGR